MSARFLAATQYGIRGVVHAIHAGGPHGITLCGVAAHVEEGRPPFRASHADVCRDCRRQAAFLRGLRPRTVRQRIEELKPCR